MIIVTVSLYVYYSTINVQFYITYGRTASTKLLKHVAFIPHLKRQCHEMDIFLRYNHFNQPFCECAYGFRKLPCLMKNSSEFVLFDWSMFSIELTSHWLQGKCARLKGTVLWDRFRKCWRKLKDLGLNKGRGWFLNFSEAPLFFGWNKTSSFR